MFSLLVINLVYQNVLLGGLSFRALHLIKGKAIPLQTWTGPEGSRRLRFPHFKTIDTWRW